MMLLKTSIATGLLAATVANAFLLPPELSEADIHIIEDYAVPRVADSQLVKIDCPGCPALVEGHHGLEIQNKKNHLEMSFSIDHLPDFDRLLLNGMELYPSPDPFTEVLTATQVLDQLAKRHRRPHHDSPVALPLDYSAMIRPTTKDAESQLELITIDLQVMGVGGMLVDGIPELSVKLLKDPSGRLAIGSIDTTAAPATEAEREACKTVVCQWLAAVKEQFRRIKAAKPCHGKPGSGAVVPSTFPSHGRPHHGHQPHPHGDWRQAHRHERSWRQLFKSIFSHILLPVLIGIVAGVSVSLIGMAVGTLVVGVWRTVFRRSSSNHHHRRHHSGHHKAVQKEAVVDEEKSGLMENQDLPPSYEDGEDAKKTDV